MAFPLPTSEAEIKTVSATIGNGVPFIGLFNVGYDFVRILFDGVHVDGCTRERATHRLVCTAWNIPPPLISNIRKRLRMEKEWRRKDYALSVCAIPLKRRQRQPTIKLRCGLPNAPIYKAASTLLAKREVLAAYGLNRATARRLRTMTTAECNRLYDNLLRANRKALRKRRKPKTT